jgi:hypothetical protein
MYKKDKNRCENLLEILKIRYLFFLPDKDVNGGVERHKGKPEHQKHVELLHESGGHKKKTRTGRKGRGNEMRCLYENPTSTL